MNFYLTHNWLVNKICNAHLNVAARKYARGKLLDIGCGDKQYKGMFEPYVTEHIGLDHQDMFHSKDNVDLFGTAYEILQKDGYFNTVLCTAVLEHLEEPDRAISEMNRVLGKNGIVILTAPLFWHLHEEPRDFYRYTKYGLNYLFEKNGFEIVELKALSGFWVTFLQELVYYIQHYKRSKVLTYLVAILGCIIQAIAYLLYKFDKSGNFTWMYLVVARKIKKR